jgi:prepilin-type N-terminal cleavage/methylation domain-containing protein
MLAKRFHEQSGYSLVEVMASIVILAIAIIPMVGMFDMGLQSATRGSNYDKARALANLKLEQAKSLSFDTVRNNFPEVAPTTTSYNASGYYQSDWKDPALTETEPASTDYANFGYRIDKQYMEQPPTDSDADPAAPSEDFVPSSIATDLIRITVTVRWPNGTTYTTLGLVSR